MTERIPVPVDAAIAVTAGIVRGGLRLGGLAATAAATAAALSPVRRWPRPVRDLARTGARYRRHAWAAAGTAYRRTAPALVLAVLDELDLATIAREVVYEIDLPEIIRVSGGSLAGQLVRETRVRIMAADDVLSRRPRP
ncbi:hypothetical protein AB0F15_38740 [Amycolatopsis sp. NPDC026612]|uniref:hypothetical protein n=1 Tax=Amycolatopsis sp. NPDC026612 TaxID=3155466 RepID=UPI0033DF563F